MANQSVSSELTEIFNFLSKTYDKITDLRDDSKTLFKEIDSLEPVGKETFKKINFGNTYDSKIKKSVDDYKKDAKTLLEQLDIDYKLFKVDMKEVYSNRETSEVMHRYTTIQNIYEQYKDLIKKREKSNFIEDVTSRANYYRTHDGFVLYSLMLSIIHVETEVNSVLDKIKKALSDFVHGKKNKKEEDDD